MDYCIDGEENLRQLCLVIGMTHSAGYMYMLWSFATATHNDYHRPGDYNSEPTVAYILMALLCLAEATSSFILLIAIAMRRAAYMLPWLTVTATVVIFYFFSALTVLPSGLMFVTVLIVALSAIAFFPVFSLYRKYKTVSTPPPVYGIVDNYPLNTPETIGTAPPPETYAQDTSNNTASASVLGGEPPSYDAAMQIATVPPYPPVKSSNGFISGPPYPVDPPYPLANSSESFTAGPPYPVVDPPYPVAGPPYPVAGPSTAPIVGWRTDLGQKK